jgi:hypothetical protein
VTTQAATEAPARPSKNEVVQTASTGAKVIVGSTTGYSPGTQADYSSLNLHQMWQAWQKREQAAAPAQGVEVAHARQVPDTNSDAEPSAIVTPAVVEAYEWKTAVTGLTSEDISLDGWKRLQAVDHWPVIHWNPESQARTAMISYSAATMLAGLAEVKLQADAAIVFGKIPAGWNIEFSDRAEKVIYTDDRNRFDASSDAPRYFAFLNAAPGMQTVTLTAALGAETAAMVVPVLNGSSTYLDLTAVSKRSFNGYVLDASAQSRKGVKGAEVGVVGQRNAVFFATESGYFNFSEVYTVGNYPIFVETNLRQPGAPDGFTHRYRITPDKMEAVELFRMADAQIDAWIAQLKGGVSPDSGLIVAAMPGLVKRYGEGRLFAGTRTLLPNRTLVPETYQISEQGELEVGKPLEYGAPRFVSVQVPSGPIVSRLEDNNRNVVWSELVPAQRGVVNVVGPY